MKSADSRGDFDDNYTIRGLLSHDHVWFKQTRRESIRFRELSRREFLANIITSSRFRLLFYIRLMRKAHISGHSLFAAIIRKRLLFKYGVDVSPKAEIGPGLQLPHPQGVIIGGSSKIGLYVQIGQFCTIGGNLGKKDREGGAFPTLGDHVRVLAGTVVAGPVTVGDNTIIGANSVVVQDIPEKSLAQGVPAGLIKRDGVTLPSVEERITRLEEKLNQISLQRDQLE